MVPADCGCLLRLSGREADAQREFEVALRLRPDFPEAHTNLGTLLARQPAHLREAVGHFEAALRVDPNFAPARNNLDRANVPGVAMIKPVSALLVFLIASFAAFAAGPRLILTPARLAGLKDTADATRRDLRAHALDSANQLVADTIPKLRDANNRHRRIGDTLPALGLAYQLTGERRYADAADRWLQALLAVPDWKGSQSLGRSAWMTGAALLYDWLGETLPETTRQRWRERLVAEGEMVRPRRRTATPEQSLPHRDNRDGSRCRASRTRTRSIRSYKFSWMDFIAYDPSVAPVDLTTLPRFRHFEDNGFVIARSGWEPRATEPEARLLRVEE